MAFIQPILLLDPGRISNLEITQPLKNSANSRAHRSGTNCSTPAVQDITPPKRSKNDKDVRVETHSNSVVESPQRAPNMDEHETYGHLIAMSLRRWSKVDTNISEDFIEIMNLKMIECNRRARGQEATTDQ